MFVVNLAYKVDLSLIDAGLTEHAEWLEKQYADGVFVLSGRQVPRTGGLILAVNTTREGLDRRLSSDPFHQRDYADYTIIECSPTRVADGLERLHD
jgi:uncharacterized protein YciI